VNTRGAFVCGQFACASFENARQPFFFMSLFFNQIESRAATEVDELPGFRWRSGQVRFCLWRNRLISELLEVVSKQDGSTLSTRSAVLVDDEGDDCKQFEITFWRKDALAFVWNKDFLFRAKDTSQITITSKFLSSCLCDRKCKLFM